VCSSDLDPPPAIEADDLPPVRTAPGPYTMRPAGSKFVVLRLITHENAVCKYATQPGVPYDDMPNYFLSTGGMIHATPASEGIADGKVVSFYVKARNEGGHTNEDDYRIDAGVKEPGDGEPVRIELAPDAAKLVAPMALVADETTPGGKYVASADLTGVDDRTKGTAEWTFTIPRAGDYAVWARVMAPHYKSDTYFASMDGGPEDIFFTEPVWEVWLWRTIGCHDGMSTEVRPARLFQLTRGEHRFVLRNKKAGLRVARLVVTDDPTLAPQGDALVPQAGKTWPQRQNPVGGAGPADPGAQPAGADGTLIAPLIFPNGGLMTSPTLVSFTWPIVDSGAQTEIRFTTDGSEPNEKSPLYKGPFLVSDTCTVKARAFRDGSKPSAVVAADFQRGTSATPAVMFSGEPERILPAGTREAKIKVLTREWAACRYAFERGVDFDKMPNTLASSGGVSHTTTITGLADGDVKTVFVKAKDGSGNITPQDYVIAVGVADAGAAQAPAAIAIEAEAGRLTAPMKVSEDGTIKYVSSDQKDSGETALTFTAPATGEYVVWAHVFGPAMNADSLFVGVDGAAEDVFDAAENASGKWLWAPVNGRDNRGPLTRNPRKFILAKSEHTLVFRGREPGCRLDKIVITNDPKYKPAE
jgi:hypothetical protein